MKIFTKKDAEKIKAKKEKKEAERLKERAYIRRKLEDQLEDIRLEKDIGDLCE